MRTIVVLSRKGGVGKTTTVHALGYGLKKKRKKVLFIDFDGQANLSLLLGATETPDGSYNLLMGKADIHDLIQHTENGDVIAADEILQAVDVELAMKGKKALQNAPNILARRLKPIENEYDYVLIDTPAALNVITESCLSVADKVIIPLKPEILSLQGVPRVFEVIDYVRENYNADLIVDGFLLTQYSDRHPVYRFIKDELAEYSKQYNTPIYKTSIRESIKLKESQAMMQNVADYSKDASVTQDYNDFVKEFLKGEKTK